MKLKDKPDIQSRLYSFNFVKRLPTGDTFATAAGEVRGGDVVCSNVTPDGTKIKFRLSGGTPGTDCEVMIYGTTVGGETPAEPVFISITG
jgi:hypothetical protein